jgi:Flp pilus assembly protein TadG
MASRLPILPHPESFPENESGGITVFGIFAIGLMLMIVGVAVDVTNAYQHKALMQITADSAAQGGIVALARGEDISTVRKNAEALVEMNMPKASYGELITNVATELQVLHYDPGTKAISRVDEDSPANAVIVRLQRSEAAGNPLPTFLMRMFGHDSWSLTATSVAVLVPTQRCSNAEGIIARGNLDLGDSPEIATGFCLHSQTAITLSVKARETGPLRISLPNPAACEGKCAPEGGSGTPHPDVRPMALNLVTPSMRSHVARLALGFLDPTVTLPEETSFFATRPLEGDPEALREVGLDSDSIRAGDVLRMTAMQFSQLRERPAGLVYDVRCDTVENDQRPVWERTLTLIGNGYGPTLRDLVLVTDCAIEMDDTARIEGALILMAGPEEIRIQALSGATLADPKAKCDPKRRVWLMALGDMALPAELARSNVTAVAGGSLRLERDAERSLTSHTGLVLHVGGNLTADGNHKFDRCHDAPTFDPLMPELQIISHVMPSLKDFMPPPEKLRPKVVLPGEKIERLSMEGTVPSES